MKIWSRILSVILAMTFVVGQSITAVALNEPTIELTTEMVDTINGLVESDEPENHIAALKLLEGYGLAHEQVVYNEYDAYLRDKAILESTPVSSSDFVEKSIETIADFEERFPEKIRELNTRSDEQLQFLNYTDDQIYAIRNFDGSPEMMRRAAATCTVYGGFNNWSATSTKTTTQMIAAFQWNGEYTYGALLGNKDIFATTWTAPFQSELEDEEGYVTYKYSKDIKSYTDSYSTTAKGLFASQMVFKNSKSAYYNGTVVSYLVSGGSIICYLSSEYRERMATGFASYGKNKASVTPALSVTPDGVSMSLEYTEKVTDVASDRWNYPE